MRHRYVDAKIGGLGLHDLPWTASASHLRRSVHDVPKLLCHDDPAPVDATDRTTCHRAEAPS